MQKFGKKAKAPKTKASVTAALLKVSKRKAGY